jgi:hypothetical protein
MPPIFMGSIRAALSQIRRFPAASFICFRGFQMRIEKITNIQGLIAYVKENSEWQIDTIHHVITALGYRSTGGLKSLWKITPAIMRDCPHNIHSKNPPVSAGGISKQGAIIMQTILTTAHKVAALISHGRYAITVEHIEVFEEALSWLEKQLDKCPQALRDGGYERTLNNFTYIPLKFY